MDWLQNALTEHGNLLVLSCRCPTTSKNLGCRALTVCWCSPRQYIVIHSGPPFAWQAVERECELIWPADVLRRFRAVVRKKLFLLFCLFFFFFLAVLFIIFHFDYDPMGLSSAVDSTSRILTLHVRVHCFFGLRTARSTSTSMMRPVWWTGARLTSSSRTVPSSTSPRTPRQVQYSSRLKTAVVCCPGCRSCICGRYSVTQALDCFLSPCTLLFWLSESLVSCGAIGGGETIW